MMNEINKALTEANKSYAEMKHRPIVVIFNHLLTIKESYLIARGGEKNPFVIAAYIEAILTIMNPVTPHFCQHVWQKHVLPILSKSTNTDKTWNETLILNGWPKAGAIDADLNAQLKYLEGTKREIRLALDKSKAGGKKKGKKGAAAAPEAPKESCVIAIGSTFPEFQAQILAILGEQQWDDNGAIIGNEYIAAVRAAITDKKKQGLAMKFAAFVVKEATEVGKDQALMQRMPFDEKDLAESNRVFLFENMASIKNISIVAKEDASIDAIEGARAVADNAVPGKPSIVFH